MDDSLVDQEQEAESSPNKSSNAYQNAMRARRGYKQVSGARKLASKAGKKLAKRIIARTAIALAANPEIWIPLLLVGIIVMVLIIVLFGTPEATNGGQPILCTTVPGGSCQTSSSLCPLAADGTQTVADTTGDYTCSTTGTTSTQVCCLPQKTYAVPDCSTIDQRLQSDFGVIIKQVGESVSCVKRQEIYRIYSIPFQSATYAKYLKPSSPFTLEFDAPDTSACASHAYTASPYLIKFWGLSKYLGCGSEKTAGFFILHETGHIIAGRNYTLFKQQFPYRSLAQSDPYCFIPCGYGPQPKTYSLCWDNEANETFAETNSLYIYNSKVGTYGTISDFKNQCPDIWKYQYNTLYGGTIVSP